MGVWLLLPPSDRRVYGGANGVYLVARYSCSIDWLSAVLPIVPMGEGSELVHIGSVIERTLVNEIGTGLAHSLFEGLHPLGYGRSPYEQGWQNSVTGVTIWAGGEMPHFTVELSGKGLAYLRSIEGEQTFLAQLSSRLSRIDVAVDLEQGISPDEFLKLRKGGRQLSDARFSSPSGETRYVGSRHSERYLRVYRYSSPHPRSHLLRVEMVFKRAHAKQVGAQILSCGLDAVAKTGLEDFGFGGLVDFDESVQEADLSVFRPERNMGKTLRWLIVQVAPAFRKLVAEGTIPDPVAFCYSYLIPEDWDQSG